MTGTKPVALAYVGGREQQGRDRQSKAVADYARVEGYTLSDVLIDEKDGITISELVESARLRGASVVIVPVETRMARVGTRLAQELEPHSIAGLVIGVASASVSPATTTHPDSALVRGRAARTSDGTP